MAASFAIALPVDMLVGYGRHFVVRKVDAGCWWRKDGSAGSSSRYHLDPISSQGKLIMDKISVDLGEGFIFEGIGKSLTRAYRLAPNCSDIQADRFCGAVEFIVYCWDQGLPIGDIRWPVFAEGCYRGRMFDSQWIRPGDWKCDGMDSSEYARCHLIPKTPLAEKFWYETSVKLSKGYVKQGGLWQPWLGAYTLRKLPQYDEATRLEGALDLAVWYWSFLSS